MDFKALIKPLIGIFLIIAISSIGIRILTSSDTLADYANNNPEIAYATPEKIPDNEVVISEVPDKDIKIEDITTEENETTVEDTVTVEERYTKEDDFIIMPITDEIKNRITGISYPADDEGIGINLNDLRYLNVKYYDFNNEIQTGELICNEYIAEDLIDIFYELFINEYQIEKIKLIDEYQGDDDLSMADNNSSSFNYRTIANTSKLSNHALGLAIDINPFYNPYIVPGKGVNGGDYIVPEGSQSFCDRSLDFNHKIDHDDLCYKLFIEHGFKWGGDWKNSKDYQHFDKSK